MDISKNIAKNLGESSFFPKMIDKYCYAPSAIIIRTAEIELLNSINFDEPVLDLCCGDGFFASLFTKVHFDAGCDFSERAVHSARKKKIYNRLDIADITKKLPYCADSFRTVISNSALEHVENIDEALNNVIDVIENGGNLVFTLASNYAYDWWPCGNDALKKYLSYQPVYNHYSIDEWEIILNKAGFKLDYYFYYLNKKSTKILMFLDYHFSSLHYTSGTFFSRMLVKTIKLIPSRILYKIWKFILADIQIKMDSEGGGLLIIAKKR